VSHTVRMASPGEAAGLHQASWGGDLVVGHGTAYQLSTLPTLVAVDSAGAVVGALTWVEAGDSLEVVSIDATPTGQGIGTALLDSVIAYARERGRRRIWLITTNDNLDALRFYQRRGMRITKVTPDAVEHSRRLKPGIPEIGAYGIPIRDELTLELFIAELSISRPQGHDLR
jgi:GNAT superfamily N-acetyltransferase